MAVGSVAAGKAYVIISALDKTRAGIDQAKANLNAFAKKYDAISQNLLSKGTQMAAMGAGALTGPLAALNSFAEFDRVMLAAQAKMHATGQEYKELSELAREYGRSTSWTAQQVAENILTMASQGLTKEKMEVLLPQTLSLARAVSSDDLAGVTETLLSTINATGGTFEDAARYADVFTTAINGSAMGMDDFAEALKMSAPFAKSANVQIEQLSAGLMAMANAGVKGSMAGTAMKNFLSKLAKKDSFFQSYGIEVFNEDETFKSFDQIFADIQARLRTLSEKERMNFIMQAFGAYGAAGISNMFASGDMGMFLEQLRNSAGEAERTAAHMESGIWGSLQRIKSAWAETWLNFGKVFEPVAKSLEWAFVGVANILSKIINSNSHWLRLLAMGAGLLVGIGGILIVIGIGAKLVALGMSMAALATGLFGKALAVIPIIFTKIIALAGFLLTPLGIAIAVTAALLALFTNFWGILGKTFSGFINLISQGRIQDAWELLCLGMKALWLDFVYSIGNLFHGMIKGIMEGMSNIGPLWRAVMGDISFDDWAQAYDDENEREKRENDKRIAELKAKVEAANAGELPGDVKPLGNEGELPEAQLGEMTAKKLAGSGALGQTIATAITAGTQEFYQKFQENRANATGQGALDTIADNTGNMASDLASINARLADMEDMVGL